MYCYEYPHAAVTTDCVVFGFDGWRLRVLLVERGIEPFKGWHALPGGFVRMEESVDDCARRELREETGLTVEWLRQFHTFGSVGRDPRERVITVAYLGLVKLANVTGGDDAASAAWHAMDELPRLAFDHSEIVAAAVASMRQDIHFHPIGFDLLPREFTLAQLQRLYEAVLGVEFDRRNFDRKILKLGLVTPVEGRLSRGQGGRPAAVYRFDEAQYREFKQAGFRLEF